MAANRSTALEFRLRLNSADFRSAMDRAVGDFNRGMRGMETSARESAGRIRTALRNALDLPSVAAGATSMVKSMTAVAQEAIKLEKAMADVKKVVDFPTPTGLKELETALLEMSRNIPIAADGLAQIAAAGGQLGVAAKDLPAFTEQVARIATAFDMLPDQAGEKMAKLANVFKIPVTQLESFGNTINELSNNTAAKASEIVEALTRVGGTARQFGLAKEEAAALVDTLIALGKEPEVAARGVNALLSKLQTATSQGKKFQEGLDLIGTSAKELETSIGQNAQQALLDFLNRMKEVDNQTRATAAVKLFGAEWQDDINILVGSLDKYVQALGIANDKTQAAGSIQREFAAKAGTTANQLQLLENRFNELKTRIGQALLPILNEILKPLSSLLGVLVDLSEESPKAALALTAIGTALVGIGSYKGGAAILRTVLQHIRGVPAAATPATQAVRSVGDSFGYLSGRARPAVQSTSRIGTAMGALGRSVTSAGTILRGFAGFLANPWVLATGAAVVGIGAIGKAMWDAEKAETAVENRAKGAAQAFQSLAAQSPKLAELLGQVGESSAKITGLTDQQLQKLRELISAKNQAIAAERSRLELEEQRPVLGLLTDHKQKLQELTAEERRLMEVLRESIQVEKSRQSAAEESLDAQKQGIREVGAAVDGLREKVAAPAKLKVDAEKPKVDMTEVEQSADAIKEKVAEPSKLEIDTEGLPEKIQEVQDALTALTETEVNIPITVESEEAQTRLEALREALENLSGSMAEVTVQADTEGALSSIQDIQNALDDLDGTVVDTYVVTHHEDAYSGGGLVGRMLALTRGGNLPGYGGGDRIPALLEAGEFVIRKERARLFSGLLNLMNYGSISRIQRVMADLPGFQTGGIVQHMHMSPVPQLAMAGGGSVPAAPVERFDVRWNGRPVASSPDPGSQLRGLLDELKESSRGLLP